jgi:anthranilate phosphoribosyltransferase
MAFLPFLEKAVSGGHLSASEAEQAMDLVFAGGATTAQLAAMLVALRMKGETADELYGFARAMRARAVRVETGLAPEQLLDTCGTGGDGANTFNISTVAAFVVAGAGARVAKHGNRSISSHCGSADVLEGLGVTILTDPARMAECIRETGFGFLFAPALHPAMKHAQPARLELKMRTVFNFLGPLTNPAGAGAQLVGAPSPRAAELMAHALARLGLVRGFVVHGLDGLDEITLSGDTVVYEIREGEALRRVLSPADFGIPAASLDTLRTGGLEDNVRIARAVLAGGPGPQRDIVLVNAAAALVAAGLAADFVSGVSLAAQSIDTGRAAAVLDRVREFTAVTGVAH